MIRLACRLFIQRPVCAALLAAIAGLAPSTAQAQSSGVAGLLDDLGVLIQTDTRLRYELGASDDQPEDGEALTLRVRPSIEIAPVPQVSLLAEAEAIVSLLPDRLNGFTGSPGRPGVADEETLELNRLQLEFAPSERFGVTVGRQRISIDDERFIGIVDFRQNQQTYDAVTASVLAPGDVQLRAGYIWRVGRVLGPERPDGVFDSDSFFVNASVPLGNVSLSGFHYDLDLDDRVNAPIRSRTTGATISGRHFGKNVGVFWEGAYARQEADGATPEYARAAVRAELGDFQLAAQFELLGSDEGVAFQTPLATLHRFQGAADLFLVTPDQGIEDYQFRATWRVGSLGPARAMRISLQYNRFDAASGDARLGQEWGAEIATTLLATRLSAALARYEAESFASDATRFWLTAARKF